MNIFNLMKISNNIFRALVIIVFFLFMLFPLQWYLVDSLKTDTQKIVSAEKILPYNSVTGEIEIEWGKYFKKITTLIINIDVIGKIKLGAVLVVIFSGMYFFSIFILNKSYANYLSNSIIIIFNVILSFLFFRLFQSDIELPDTLMISFIVSIIAMASYKKFFSKEIPVQVKYLQFFPERFLHVSVLLFKNYFKYILFLSIISLAFISFNFL